MASKTLLIAALLLVIPYANAEKAPYALAAETNTAIEFAPGIISTPEYFEINTVFNKAGDNVIFAKCSDDFKTCTLMESDYANGQWQKPRQLSFSGEYMDADPYYSPDFQSLYYISKRPIDGGSVETESVNLWRVDRDGDSWGTPVYLKALSSDAHDLYPSMTTNGDLYFPSFRNDSRLLYIAKATKKGFAKPKALPSYMFGKDGKIGDSVVLRDGKTIIFSMRRADSLGEGDLYISHKRVGKWTVAKSLGDKVNTADHEFTPIVSPDGQYLFFTRVENKKGNLYQIPLKAILN